MSQPCVLVVDHTAQVGGGELAMLRVIAQLNETTGTQVRALVLDDGPFVERLREAGVPTAVLPLNAEVATASRHDVLRFSALVRSARRVAAFLPRLVRLLRASSAQLVVANTLKSALLVAVAAPLAGRAWVWHLHDRLAPDYLPRPLMHLWRALAVLGPRRIVVNSEATLATIPAAARRKATLAYPGLDAVDPRPSAPADPAPLVGLVGRISPTKGQREFVQAAALLALRLPAVRFRVIGAALFGEDAYETEVRALPAALSIGDRVEFTGWVSDPGARMRELTLLVHASPVPEPFGQVVAEAMAAGVPVVATAAGGIPEILDPDGSVQPGHERSWWPTPVGVLVRPGDPAALAAAIEWCLTDRRAREKRAAAAVRLAAERFTIETTAAAVWSAWSGAIDRAPLH